MFFQLPLAAPTGKIGAVRCAEAVEGGQVVGGAQWVRSNRVAGSGGRAVGRWVARQYLPPRSIRPQLAKKLIFGGWVWEGSGGVGRGGGGVGRGQGCLEHSFVGGKKIA